MACAILRTPETTLSKNTFQKHNVSLEISKLCAKNRLKEAVDTLDYIKKVGSSPQKIHAYNCLLRSIAAKRDLVLAKKVYEHITSSNLQRNAYFGTKIATMFVRCGSLVDALEVFRGVDDKNEHLLSVILNGFCRDGRFDEALNFFRDFIGTHLRLDGFILSSIIRACGGLRDLRLGKEVHGFVYRNGYESDMFVGNCLVDLYGKCRCIDVARKVFDRIPQRDVVSWNSMLKGYAQKEDFDGFIGLVKGMKMGGVKPNMITWNTMISGYAVYGCAKEALDCFYKMQSMHMKPDIISCNALMSALSQNGHFHEALELLQQMQNVGLEPDIVTWTTLIDGYVNLGCLKKALSLFLQMQTSRVVLDDFIFSVVLKACAGLGALKQGTQIHGYLLRNGYKIGAFVTASLVQLYAKCGKLACASELLSKGNIILWNSLLSEYVKNGNVEEAKDLFQRLQLKFLDPDLVSWNMMINCHAQEGNTTAALDILDNMLSAGISPDSVSWNSVVNGYAKSGQINEALKVINRMESSGFKQNPGSWNTLISNLVKHGNGEDALNAFHLMKKHGIEPDLITISCILRACYLLGALQFGKSVHGRIIRSNIRDKYINSNLLEMYIKFDDLGTAHKLFEVTRERNIVLWNGMISAFAKSGKIHEAHKLLHEMQIAMLKPDVISWTSVVSGYTKTGNADIGLEIWRQMWLSGIQPDPISITAATTACASSGALKIGKQIHGFSITTGLEKDPFVQAALITMYFKCRSMNEASCVFENAPHNSTIIWNSMISGYVINGHGDRAVSLFQRMQNESIVADSVTLVGFLSAWSQTNLPIEDWRSSAVILQDFGFKHNQEHCAQLIYGSKWKQENCF